MLKIGDKMPSFEVVDQDGNAVKSEDFIGKGRKTIVYFYPKEDHRLFLSQGQHVRLHGRGVLLPRQLCGADGRGVQCRGREQGQREVARRLPGEV